MSGRRVIVLGSVNADLTIEIPRVARPGETILGSGGRLAIGGKGFNQALASRRYGADTKMVAAIGDDAFGRQAIDEMMVAGIDTASIARSGGEPTGSAAILVTSDGLNTIAVAPGANAALSPDHARAGLTGETGSIVVAQLEVSIETVAEAFKAAKSLGGTTILNPAPAHDGSAVLFATTDIIIPNEFELAELAGTPPVSSEGLLRDACYRLVERGVGIVIVTLGERGCALFHAGDLTTIPAFKVAAIDSSGAGDTFVGTLAASLAAGATLELAVTEASAAGALSVTKKGAATSPTRLELAAFLALHANLKVAPIR
jgi:ribokinase